MAFITRLCLLCLLLTFAVMCFARNIPKENQNGLYEIEDYGETGPNHKHDPHPPPGNLYEIEDYAEPGANPKHDPRKPHPPPPLNHPKMQIRMDDNKY
uniref:Uncharacterized protein LOC105852163 n=1 Tax=Cicer arietinum TaxID=3827 RepID=A0A1S3E676_CICAR|nr:uncharacterized protein LOC105852163 [Cicer arietinum]